MMNRFKGDFLSVLEEKGIKKKRCKGCPRPLGTLGDRCRSQRLPWLATSKLGI